jgi:hypothetical protein
MMKNIIITLTILFSYTGLSFGMPELEAQLSRGIQIALVTNDPNPAIDNNLVIWQRISVDSVLADPQVQQSLDSFNAEFDSLSINYYNIHRWDTASKTYNEIGQLDYQEIPIFEDTGSEPKKQSYKYKITANITYQYTATIDFGSGPQEIQYPLTDFDTEIDSCRYHKTLLIQQEIRNDTMHVHIEPYEVEGIKLTELFQSVHGTDSIPVYVCRHHDSSQLLGAAYDTVYYVVGDTLFSYADPDPLALEITFYYLGIIALNDTLYEEDFVGMELSGFKASSGPFSQSISNIEDNRLREENPPAALLIQKSTLIDDVSIYPNPLTQESILYYSLKEEADVNIKAYHINGQSQGTLHKQRQKIGNYNIPLSGLINTMPSGPVIIYIQSGNEIISIKTINE